MVCSGLDYLEMTWSETEVTMLQVMLPETSDYSL